MQTQSQLDFSFKSWGGKRKRAGRKPNSSKPMVSRSTRPVLRRGTVMITMRVCDDIPSLRSMGRQIRRALVDRSELPGFRLIHYSIQHTHVHVVAEADDARALSNAMRRLSIHLARTINKALGRRLGKVFSDRYHERVLTSPKETRNAVVYVVNNFRKHEAEAGRWLPPEFVDVHSTAMVLAGRTPNALPEPRFWLLSVGAMRAGPIDLSATPGRIKSRPASR